MSDSVLPTQDPDVQDSKFFAAVGYFSFLCFVPLVLKKQSKFAQFHGKQALVLFIMEAAAGILSMVPVVGDLVSSFAFVVFGILSIVAILKVLMGECCEMPVVHDIASRVTL